MSLAQDSPTTGVDEETAQTAINTIRGLSMDAVQKANSGHPGLPLGMAPVAYVLYARIMNHDPSDPAWPDRDRFVLSAGHGSMLLYSVLHLSGYDLPLDEIKRFRQWESLAPGHPEFDRERQTPGVETTTGPLGAGFSTAVGMAMAEKFLRERFGSEVMDHHTYVICSDGDMMEGVSSEAASLAGHLGLGRLVYVYDDNHITIDGRTDLAFTGEDVEARFRAYGWDVSHVDDANNVDAVEAAIVAGREETERPTLIRVRSVIGWPAPNKGDTKDAHGSPLGEDEIRLTKEILGLDPDVQFAVPDVARGAFEGARERGAAAHAAWKSRMADWRNANPNGATEWEEAWSGDSLKKVAATLPSFAGEELATRAASGKVMEGFEDAVPTMMGGAADLVGSTKTKFPNGGDFSPGHAGRNIHFGIREHTMGSAVNGLALHGGIASPYGSTFLVFSDYMRPAIRLSAIMGLPVVWVFTHDSIGVGEDGPTHQPVEHYAALRAIPGLTVIRPGDGDETAQAWRVAIESETPVCLLLTRQGLPPIEHDVPASETVPKGAYLVSEPDGDAQVTLVGTGSEVQLASGARDLLAEDGIGARVVSMPSWELFNSQDDSYRESVFPAGVPVVSVEAGVAQGWQQFAGSSVSIERFGASAPAEEVFQKLGITAEAVAETAKNAIQEGQ